MPQIHSIRRTFRGAGLWGLVVAFPLLLCETGCSGAVASCDAPECAAAAPGSETTPAPDTIAAPSEHFIANNGTLRAGVPAAPVPAAPPSAAVPADPVAPQPAVSAVFVDPVSGEDDNDGSPGAPFRTLKHALGAVQGGVTVYLKPGTYCAQSGEDWSGKVPAGVTIRAVKAGAVTLLGSGTETGLDFSGSGTLSGVSFDRFRHAVGAWSGEVSIEGSAVHAGGGFDVAGSAHVTVTGVTMKELEFSALSVRGAADVVVTGGTLAGTGPRPICDGEAGLRVTGQAAVHLTGVTIRDFAVGGVSARDAAEVDLTTSTLTGSAQAGCDGAQIVAAGSSGVYLNHTVVADGGATGLLVQESASLDIDDTSVGAHGVAGVRATGGTLAITGGVVHAGTTGVVVVSAAQETHVTLDGTALLGNVTGVELGAGAVARLRGTQISGGDYGVHAPTAASVFVDLGSALDPGKNSIAGKKAAITLSGSYACGYIFDAVGNTWNRESHDGAVVMGPIMGQNFAIALSDVGLRL